MTRFYFTIFIAGTLLAGPVLSSAFGDFHLWDKEVVARQNALWDPPAASWERDQETVLQQALGTLDVSLRAPFMRQFGAVLFQDFTQLVPLVGAYARCGARLNALLPQDLQESEVMRLHYYLGAKLAPLPQDQWDPFLEDVHALCNARPDAYIPYIFGATLDFFAGFGQAPRAVMKELFDGYLCAKNCHIEDNFVQTLYLVSRDVRAQVIGEIYPFLNEARAHLTDEASTDEASLEKIISHAKIASFSPESQTVLTHMAKDYGMCALMSALDKIFERDERTTPGAIAKMRLAQGRRTDASMR